MTGVGFAGLLIGLLAFTVAFVRRTRRNVTIFAALYLVQVAAATYYYIWAQTNTTDAPLYYYDEYGFYGEGFRLNTGFVIYFVQYLKELFGGTYLDYFMLFQATGAWAAAFMMRTFQEVYDSFNREVPNWAYAILFLPSLHFWTSTIGKDGPLVMATAMAAWAAIQLRSRYLVFAFAILIMVLFRPHIALVAMVALATAIFFDPKVGLLPRILLFVGALGATLGIAGTVQSAFSVDVTSVESVGEFFSAQSEAAQQFDTGTAVLGASFPVRLLSLLFRPFFFDANGLLGVIASLENLLMVFTVGNLIVRSRDTLMLSRQVFFLRFSIVFAVVLLILLAVVYYNVGLGLRQRTMAFPPLLAFLVALLAVRAQRRAATELGYA